MRALRPPWGVMGPADALAAGWWPTQLHLGSGTDLCPRCCAAIVPLSLLTEAL